MSMINPSEHNGDWRPSSARGLIESKGAADERTDQTPVSDHPRRGGGPLLSWWKSCFGKDDED